MKRFSLGRAAEMTPIDEQVRRNLYDDQPPPAAQADIYGNTEPEYRAILLSRLMRAQAVPRERSVRDMVV